jgi:anti-sigma28 factor (negative regulator of flagellin synthesis)
MNLGELLGGQVLEILLAALTTLATVAVGYATAALKRFADRQKAQWAGDILNRAAMSAERAVMTVNQTFVEEVKAASANGRLTVETGKVAFHRAWQTAARQLGEDGMKALAKAVGGQQEADLVLGDMVEQAVAKSKTLTALAQ